MSRSTGAVRFPDGEVLYFVYCGTTDIARPRLFATDKEASSWWGVSQSTIQPAETGASEEVEVMPYFGQGDTRVDFYSEADRLQLLITGPKSLDEAVRQNSAQHDSPIF